MARGSKPGERRGGRKPGTPNKSTIAQGIALSELAQLHTEAALQTLVSVAQTSDSDAARVSAAVAILDRGYGKPPQSTTIKGENGASIMVPALYIIERTAEHAKANGNGYDTQDHLGAVAKAANGAKLNGY